jgi:hypothetical protein
MTSSRRDFIVGAGLAVGLPAVGEAAARPVGVAPEARESIGENTCTNAHPPAREAAIRSTHCSYAVSRRPRSGEYRRRLTCVLTIPRIVARCRWRVRPPLPASSRPRANTGANNGTRFASTAARGHPAGLDQPLALRARWGEDALDPIVEEGSSRGRCGIARLRFA